MPTNSPALDKELQTCLMRIRTLAIVNTLIQDWHKLIDAGYDFSQEADHIQRFAQTIRKWRAREKS
jgi:Na+/phosphate symporter